MLKLSGWRRISNNKVRWNILMKIRNGEFKIELNNINHWVKIEGSENNTTPLIIIHGGPGGNHYTFERIVGPLLSNSRTLVYYEQRGCGRTDKPLSENDYSIELLIEDFKELMKWLDVEKVDILGYSFGGELALEFALVLPEDINKIILSGPSLMNSYIQKLVQIGGIMTVSNSEFYKNISTYVQRNSSIDVIYNRVWELMDTETVDQLLFEDPEIAKINRQLWQESNLINTGLLMRGIQKNKSNIPLEFRVKEIENEVLIITGIFDRNTGIPISKLIDKELVNSELVVFNKSAHFPDLEETDRFVRVVREFLL